MTKLVKSYNEDMKTVKIGELKAKLSSHLQRVRRGEEVIVCDRDKPIARIIPIRPEDHDEQMQRLIAKGMITPPQEPMPKSWPGPARGPVIPDEVMEQVWRDVRGDD